MYLKYWLNKILKSHKITHANQSCLFTYLSLIGHFQEGDRIGLMKKTSGALHYYINGVDQGVASARTPNMVWGVVDLYGMAVKVTIIEHVTAPGLGIPDSGSIGNRINFYLRQYRDAYEDDGMW